MQAAALPPFQQLLDEHGRDVLGFLVASVGPHEAEDCFQETFIAALRGYGKLRHGRHLRSWLLTIAHRKAIDHHRARGRRPMPAGAAEELDGAGRSLSGGQPAGGDPAAASGGGEIWRAVSALPPKQRSAVVLRYATDMAYADIGEMLDCSPEAARRNVFEGLETLRGELR